MNQLEKTPKPLLLIFRGIPGSGKSYFANKLIDKIGNSKVILLDPDSIDINSRDYVEFTSILNNEEVDSRLFPYRYLRNLAYEGIKDSKIILWTQAFTHLELLDRTIKNLMEYAKDMNKEINVLVVEFEVSKEIARARINNRAINGGHDVDDSNFDRFINDYKSFEQFGYETILINSNSNVDDYLDILINKIYSLGFN